MITYRRQLFFALSGLLLAMPIFGSASAAEVAGVQVRFVDESGPATFSVESISKYKLQIDIDPHTEQNEQTLQVKLPISGPQTWPYVDVEVLDSNRLAVPVRRSGITWHNLFITVPPKRSTFIVHVVEPKNGHATLRPDKDRLATDSKTGLSATICKWHNDRDAALSIRFDDSHSTHLSKAIPILNEYGFRGTFMVNPGGHPPNSRRRSAFESHRVEWDAVAKRGRHEFANHTMNHRGAKNEEEMEVEVGDATKAIWQLFPDKSKLMALNLGGGTQWVTTKTLRHYLDKHHLFDASANSTGMDDSYGNRVEKFRQLLERHIKRGLWYKVHYHYIGKGLSSSETNFRAALDIVKEHQGELWIAGMADIYKYQMERQSAQLNLEASTSSHVSLRLKCATKPELYDQPLTIKLALPKTLSDHQITVKNANGETISTRSTQTHDRTFLHFHAPPKSSQYHIQIIP